MALIQCSNCGQNISDKATKCVHCGKEFIKETGTLILKKCSECGSNLSESDSICSMCGCPVESQAGDIPTAIQAVEVAKVRISKKAKKIVIISITAIVLCTIMLFAIIYISNMNAKKEYINNLEQVQILAIKGGSEAEDLCNLVYNVWRNAIYKEHDSATDPYTYSKRYWVSDFNEALGNLYTSSSVINTVSSIEQNQMAIKEVMKSLQLPPKGLEKCYDTVYDLYSVYKTLTDLAINPSGSLTSFSAEKSSAVSNFMTTYEKLDNQIPKSKSYK